MQFSMTAGHENEFTWKVLHIYDMITHNVCNKLISSGVLEYAREEPGFQRVHYDA